MGVDPHGDGGGVGPASPVLCSELPGPCLLPTEKGQTMGSSVTDLRPL